ncbi:MAG: DUF2927 domain-containing protein [Boseongicola sp.]
MGRIVFIVFIALAACSSPEATRRATTPIELPPMKTFARATPSIPRISNAVIARDILDLTFRLENGAELPVFTRFEGPITVRVVEPAPASLRPDLRRLLERLRREAKIDIREVADDQPASIIIQPVKRSQILGVAPSAACFVRPNVTSWSEYRARRKDPKTFWNRLSERRHMAVFLPSDVSPQEIRDCLHEEISQALGPVNDIYRLNQSVFNDDNFHTVLTGYDMLILRVIYDAALRSGLSSAEVTKRLPLILARLNPTGGNERVAAPGPDFDVWRTAIDRATQPGLARGKRISSARRAVALSESAGALSTRFAFSNYVLGRLTLGSDPEEALNAFLKAGRIYQNRSDTAIQEAHVAMQLAAFQLSAGRADTALALVNSNLAVVARSEHAALLTLLLLVKAEALEVLGQPGKAAEIQREALAWARYGFGDENEIRARVAEIRAISPRPNDEGAS